MKIEVEGYAVAVYRDPNSGDMRFEITTPEDYGDQIGITVNDEPVDLP